MIGFWFISGFGFAGHRMCKVDPPPRLIRAIRFMRGRPKAVRGKSTRDGTVLATPTHIEITPRCERFSHDDACVVARTASVTDDTQMVVIDLRFAREVTTAAFARLACFAGDCAHKAAICC